MSHSAEKCKKKPWGFINIHDVAKYRKNSKGDPLVSSGFVGYVEKVKNERDPLHYVCIGRTWPK